MRKKAIAFKFLLLMIVGLLLFVPSVMKGCQLLAFSSKQQETFGGLVNSIDSPERPFIGGEIRSTDFYLEDKSVLAGFAKGSGSVEILFSDYQKEALRRNPDPVKSAFAGLKFDRPKSDKCPLEKACICLCKDSFPSPDEVQRAIECKNPKCAIFDNVDFLKEKIRDFDQNGNPRTSLKGGFLYLRGKYSVIDEDKLSTKTLYLEKYKNIVDVCTKSPCIDQATKEKINFGLITASFNDFVRKYEECKSKQNGQCGSVSMSIQGNYYIYYVKSGGDAGNGVYLVKAQSSAVQFSDMEILKDSRGNNLFHAAQLFTDENTELPTGSVIIAQQIQLEAKNSRIIIKIQGTLDRELPSNP